MKRQWRCFYCDEVFTNRKLAAEHFGSDGGCYSDAPACKLDKVKGGLLKLLREAYAELRKFQTEENASIKEFYALGASHNVALRREEEKGYARGLADGRKFPVEH